MSGKRKRAPDRARPLYTRVLRLDYLQLSGIACFFLFEGMLALAVLLSLAELVNWWSVVVLPLVVAGLVKINDLVASVFGRSKAFRRANRARGVARVHNSSAPIARGTARASTAERPPAEDASSRHVRRRNASQRRFHPFSWLQPVEPPER